VSVSNPCLWIRYPILGFRVPFRHVPPSPVFLHIPIRSVVAHLSSHITVAAYNRARHAPNVSQVERLENVSLDQDDAAIVRALRDGDEQVFTSLVAQWSSMMLRLALSHVDNRAVAEEVVQEAWLTMLRSLERFEQRSSLRTWIIGIVINLARSRARAERRSAAARSEASEPAVDPSRFLPSDHPRWPNHWAAEPVSWKTPEDHVLAAETRRVLFDAIEALPAAQREVLVLRDLEGVSAADVCNVMGLTDTHQRVLLHRARSRVRHALERYLAAAETA
jgi:RNA polymerase sigma-70 factor, ECF subfamily